MDATLFAKKLSNTVVLVPPIAYGILLLPGTGALEYLVLLASSFLFFAYLPQKFIESFQKLPRNPKTKLKAVYQFVLTFAAGFVVQWAFNAPAPVLAFSASLVAGHVVAYFVTPYWLISTHSMMSTQPMIALALQGRLEAVPIAALWLLYGWARIHLKAHTPMQYITGGVVGALLTAMAMSLV